jgi:hypothetical protein
MRTITVIAGLALTIAALAACSATPAPIRVRGTMQVQENCNSATLDYPDIAAGDQVVITSPSGKVIATTSLGSQDAVATGDNGAGECDYPFTARITEDQPRYGIAIGNNNRGTVWFSRAEMRKGPALSLTPSATP